MIVETLHSMQHKHLERGSQQSAVWKHRSQMINWNEAMFPSYALSIGQAPAVNSTTRGPELIVGYSVNLWHTRIVEETGRGGGGGIGDIKASPPCK